MRNKYFIAVLFIALIAAACGTPAQPAPNSQTLEAEQAADHGDETTDVVAQEPTETPVPPTETPVPPTATPTEIPASPTPEPTEEVAASDEYELTGDDELILFFVESGSPTRGEALFTETHTVAMTNGTLADWACSTCHNVSSTDPGVGPGMLGLPTRAAERVPGMPAPVYIYHSIINPHEYIVENFSDGVMPAGYVDVFSETELYDIVSYLLQLPNE